MLMYHPAQDINHCLYRLILILELSEKDSINIETYRVMDFYTLFPHLLKMIKPLPNELRSYREAFNKIKEPFEAIKNTKRVMFELENFQSICIQNLIAKGLLDKKSFTDGQLKINSANIPKSLKDSINNSKFSDECWFKAIINHLPDISFNGKKGLKARSGLMEFRYDLEKS
ncbi:hypothetical protein Q5V23_001439 [Vibrio fluvialis]|nr:hypothetical protein [Vibrio fluvialis]